MRDSIFVVFFAVALSPGVVNARADVRIAFVGAALNDATSVAPAGGNPGTTLGEQRRRALEYAAQVWGERLDSAVPITVQVAFSPLPCDESSTVIGAASTTALFTGVSSNGADPALFYPAALANRLAGEDLDPAEPEIQMELNGEVDGSCRISSGGFYYGFDRRGEGVDLVETVLHELAHGLGLASFADPETGALFMGEVDPYTALVRDLDVDAVWSDLDDVGRATSAQRLRRLAWDGARARAATRAQFDAGTPALSFAPPVPGYSGLASDTSFGRNPALGPVAGLVVPVDAVGCEIPAAISGKIPLLRRSLCNPATAAEVAREAGAIGALLVVPSPFDAPALPEDIVAEAVDLPILTVSGGDADAIEQALATGEVRAEFGGIPNQRIGADSQGRPLLFASDPVSASSSISHLEPLVRPQQMMEPITGPVPTHDVSFTLAMLADLGWQQRCGDGVVDDGEACDEGSDNSDTTPDRCRSNCQLPGCGDHVRDEGEACDADNSDTEPNACRANCELPRCGDGVVDDGEICDRGSQNSDDVGSTCRTSCRRASCGDGVRDDSEACDDGAQNSDTEPGACRLDCTAAACGDGVVDPGEACDLGARNSDTRPGACRTDCGTARCGDDVVDPGESCDGTRGCPSTCRSAAAADLESSARANASRPLRTPGAGEDAGERDRLDGGAGEVHEASCSCRVVQATDSPKYLAGFALIVLLASVRSLRRERARTNKVRVSTISG